MYVTPVLTGIREKERAKLEWQYLDLEMGTITLIEENVKARRQHESPMPDYLWSLMQDRHRKRSSVFVFPPATDNTRHVRPVEVDVRPVDTKNQPQLRLA